MATILASAPEFERLASEILASGHILRFRAQGMSMFPNIRDGDILEVRPPGNALAHRGDILLCRRENGRLLAHRVRRVVSHGRMTYFELQGDYLRLPDGLFGLEQVLGRVTVVEREGRRWRLDSTLRRLLAFVWIGARSGYHMLVRCNNSLRGL